MRNFICAAIAFFATVNAKHKDKHDNHDNQPNSKTDSEPEDKLRYENLMNEEALSAPFRSFVGWSDYWRKYTDLYIKGLDDRYLATNHKTLVMGRNNRGWVQDGANSSSTYWSLWHNYLGGSFEYDVDLSCVECACQAGIYLVNFDDENCSWDPKDAGETPQCARIEIMEANVNGFRAASYPCDFGVCPDSSETQAQVSGMQYGQGDHYVINTQHPFNVRTRFFKNDNNMLAKIETTLTQNKESIRLIQDDPDFLASLTSKLTTSGEKMATVIATNDLGRSNELSKGTCANSCSVGKAKLSEMMWLKNDSRLVRDEGYMVIGDLAPSVDLCGEGCSACNEAWYSNNGNKFYTCTDTTVYKYSNKCDSYPLQELCGSDDIANGRCYFSWPHGDSLMQRSNDFACRPLPDNLVSGDWVYSETNICGLREGLCGNINVITGYECRESWREGQDASSSFNMCRPM